MSTLHIHIQAARFLTPLESKMGDNRAPKTLVTWLLQRHNMGDKEITYTKLLLLLDGYAHQEMGDNDMDSTDGSSDPTRLTLAGWPTQDLLKPQVKGSKGVSSKGSLSLAIFLLFSHLPYGLNVVFFYR